MKLNNSLKSQRMQSVVNKTDHDLTLLGFGYCIRRSENTQTHQKMFQDYQKQTNKQTNIKDSVI